MRQPRNAAQADRLASVRSALEGTRGDMVLLEFVGAQTGKMTYKGKATGTVYRFANTPEHRLHYVYRADAETLLTLPIFRLKASPETSPAVERPPAPVAVSRSQATTITPPTGSPQRPLPGRARGVPSPEDDLTQIRGISKRRAEALGEAGIRRYRDLMLYSAPELLNLAKQAGLKGVLTEELMAGWIEQAKELSK